MAGDKFINSGDFRGAAVFQGSSIANAGQIAGMIGTADQGGRAALQALLRDLGDHLKTVPAGKGRGRRGGGGISGGPGQGEPPRTSRAHLG